MASTTLYYLTKGVGLSIWAWDGITEKIGNVAGFCVTNGIDLVRKRTPLSDAIIETTSNWANRAKEFKISSPYIHPLDLFKTSLNTTGEKVDAFINKKSNTETQNSRTCAAIVEAAKSADFPAIKEKESIALETFNASVKRIMTPSGASLSWSDYYGFATQQAVQFGLTSLVRTGLLFYTLSYTNSYALKLLIGGAATWGYSYLALPHARKELKEAINPTAKNKLESLTKKQFDAITEQAKTDFSLNSKMGTVNFAYSENWGRFEAALKEIGQVQEEEPESVQRSPKKHTPAPSPAKKTMQQQTDASNGEKDVLPLVSSTPKKSRLEIKAPKYEGLSRATIENWGRKIFTDIDFERLTLEEANIVLNEQLEVVNDYISKAVKQRLKEIKADLEGLATFIDNQIIDNVDKIDRAQLQAKRTLAGAFDASAAEEGAPSQSRLSWLTSCCRGKQKVDEQSPEGSPIVGRREDPEAPPSTIRRRNFDQSVNESNAFDHIKFSPPRDLRNQSQANFSTPAQRDE